MGSLDLIASASYDIRFNFSCATYLICFGLVHRSAQASLYSERYIFVFWFRYAFLLYYYLYSLFGIICIIVVVGLLFFFDDLFFFCFGRRRRIFCLPLSSRHVCLESKTEESPAHETWILAGFFGSSLTQRNCIIYIFVSLLRESTCMRECSALVTRNEISWKFLRKPLQFCVFEKCGGLSFVQIVAITLHYKQLLLNTF